MESSPKDYYDQTGHLSENVLQVIKFIQPFATVCDFGVVRLLSLVHPTLISPTMAPTATASAPQTVNTVDPDASDYDSSADSDFAGSLSASSSESETERKAPKRKAQGEGVDSGDEGVIEEGSRKRRRKKKGKENEEEEGVGLRLRKRKEGHTRCVGFLSGLLEQRYGVCPASISEMKR